jgi:hypothetical protein
MEIVATEAARIAFTKQLKRKIILADVMMTVRATAVQTMLVATESARAAVA